jgi:hypothetical protein
MLARESGLAANVGADVCADVVMCELPKLYP